MPNVARNLIAYWSIGFSADDAAKRNVGWGIPTIGWPGFAATLAQPLVDAGVRRLELHNPFGSLNAEPMQLTQYEQAIAAGLTWLTDDFVETWIEFTDREVEVIAYVGSAYPGDQLLDEAADAEEREEIAKRNLQPFIDAGMSIAFDAASGAVEGDLTHQLIEWLETQGVKVYIEAIAGFEYLQYLPAMFLKSFIEDPDYPTWGLFESTSEMIEILVVAPAGTHDIREIWDQGFTAMVSPSVELIEDLVEEEKMGLRDSLISYWSVNEASGQRNDSHGTNHLADNNTVTSGAGKVGLAGTFVRANTEFLSRASNASLQIGDIDCTFACWVKIASTSGSQIILSKDTDTSREYALAYNVGLGGTVTKFSLGIAGYAGWVADPTVAIVGTWYHIIAWHDSTNNLLGITVNNATPTTVAHGTGIPSGAAEFRIGAAAYPGFPDSFDGQIDEVVFWKRLLTSAERTQLYNAGAGTSYEQVISEPSAGQKMGIGIGVGVGL